LKKSFSRIWDLGTHYVESERLQKLLTSSQLKVKPKYLNISGLQLADLIAHSSRRFMFRKFDIAEGKRYTFGDKIIEIIEHKYYKSKDGIEGYGIKLLP